MGHSVSVRRLDMFLIVFFAVVSVVFMALSVFYMLTDRPLVSLLSLIIGIVLLSSSLGVYRSSRGS